MDTFNLTFPIDMVKKEQRIVSGIATADNIDKVGDLVDFNASLEAFKNWQGNIREMHAPIAVGKAISYKPIKIKAADGEEYNAIQVEAYISKGAESTWQKVLDGTLRAFSIGGKILKKEMLQNRMHNGRQVHVIKQYDLGELSLVDNPANAIATIDLVKRNDDGDLKYVLDIIEEEFEKAKQPLKDPKGGLTAAGRRHFKQTEGANLKPGVRGPADTPEKMRRKGSFLVRFFTNPSGPMKKPDGKPTRLALSAAAWGEPVPQNRSDAAKLAAKGRRMLERYRNIKEKNNKSYTPTEVEGLILDRIVEEIDNSNLVFEEYDENNDIANMLLDMIYEEVINQIGEGEYMENNEDIEKAAPTKREGGQNFPAAAFAYVPDPQKPSTWKLRLWDNLEAKETAAQVGRAVAAIGAGFRGNKVSIPDADMPAVKRKILAAWKKTNKDKKPTEIPSVLKFDDNDDFLLQNDVQYDKVKPMDNLNVDNDTGRLSLIKKFVTWLSSEPSDVELLKFDNAEVSQSEAAVETEQMEEQDMNIEVLKEALGSVIDQKLNDFATSLKAEVEADVAAKIDEVAKSFETQKQELTDKLTTTEKALEEQTAKVEQIANAGAVKKSVDPEDNDEEETIVKSAPKSVWNNIYLPQTLIESLGYKS